MKLPNSMATPAISIIIVVTAASPADSCDSVSTNSAAPLAKRVPGFLGWGYVAVDNAHRLLLDGIGCLLINASIPARASNDCISFAILALASR